MSGILSSNYRGGHRSELLADYLLSGIGLTTPVRRQDDTGFDFYCQLANQEKGILSFGNPFILQVKSDSVESVDYGNEEPKKWRRENIDWLFELEIPLLIGVVDKSKTSISIYHVTPLWFVYYESKDCSRIRLVPRKAQSPKPIDRPTSEKIEKWPMDKGDGNIYNVDLGNPIVTIEQSDFDDLGELTKKKQMIRSITIIEQSNILLRKMIIHHFQWIHISVTNSTIRPAWYYSAANTDIVSNLYRSLTPGLISLLINLKAQNRIGEIENLKPILKHLPQELIYPQLRENFKEIFDS